MNAANNFKRLQEEDEERFPPPPEIEENVFDSLRILGIMGQAMELYIPKAFEMFILTLGGTIREIDSAAQNNPDPALGDAQIDPEDGAPGMAKPGNEEEQ